MLRTHSCQVVLLYSNLFFVSTYVLYVVINCLYGTREALDMTILGSDQWEITFAGPVHDHRDLSTPRITLMMGREIVDYHPSDMMVSPTFCIFDYSLAMFSSSSLLSVAEIIFQVNV